MRNRFRTAQTQWEPMPVLAADLGDRSANHSFYGTFQVMLGETDEALPMLSS